MSNKSSKLLPPQQKLLSVAAYGANGVEFNKAGTAIYVASTAFHQIIQIPVNANGTAGAASILITGINAPDGVAIDKHDNLWVCANGGRHRRVDKTGKVIAKLGDFNGIDDPVRSLLFPASLAFGLDGETLYVSNLTLFLPFAGAQTAVDSPSRLRSRATRSQSFAPSSGRLAMTSNNASASVAILQGG
jgi:sugar lactone lactonase YvrE